MHDSSARPVLSRCLSLAAALALAGWALLLPAKPAHAFAMPPRCPAGDSTYIVYYNNAQHQQVVGTTTVDCNQVSTHTGEISGFFTETCSPCS
jgi:hypothetical protein